MFRRDGSLNFPPKRRVPLLRIKADYNEILRREAAAEERIDRNIKNYLYKCWNLRSEVTGAMNEALCTSFGIYTTPGA